MSLTLPHLTKDLFFFQPAGCGTCEFARPDGPSCPRNTALGAMLAIKATMDGEGYHTEDEAVVIATQVEEMGSMAQECVMGLANGNPPIELRAAANGITFHILQAS